MNPSRQTMAYNIRRVAHKSSANGTSAPPPAYTPNGGSTITVPLPHDLVRDTALLLSRRPETVVFGTGDEDSYGRSEEEISPISLRINTSIHVTNNNNYICLDTTPTEQANSIAKAVVKALQEHSSGHCGIPMIDEDGRPRPVNIEVDASMMIDGVDNVVGSEAMITQAMAEKHELKRQREDDSATTEAVDAEASVKRRRVDE